MIEHFVILALLILAHVVGDFYLQTSRSIKSKSSKGAKTSVLANIRHAASHTVLALIVLLFASSFELALIWASLVIGGTHFMIDLIKSRLSKCKGSLLCFTVDQLLHLLVILSVWAYLFGYFAFINLDTLREATTLEFVAVVLAYLLILRPTSILIQFVLRPWRLSNNTDNNNQDTDEPLDKAGSLIGILERFIILTLILMNQFTAIGFVIAAKSILRFKEESKHEYVLLGTVTSLAIVLIIGLITQSLLN
ncbi:DUF3307 domain-containing protein [Idiomarina sp. M1R2S28]|uniref:DUF3307 domain-containing protein n=1 Tax=Idiomarina rhizosphaerae TaxID=2961572 RepID=A0A9X2JQY5_9GAMM|nr:DUF3307 domain-containing protein [Idiomarina rhizosphaerae]MCP1338817.1 DUF3307 domain-containing protein [Idiomarina rhizosphaerae]